MMKAIKKPKQNQKKKQQQQKNSTLFANSKTTDLQYDGKPTFDETLLQATFVPLC